MRINVPEKIRRRVWVKLIKNLISNVPEDFNRILKGINLISSSDDLLTYSVKISIEY